MIENNLPINQNNLNKNNNHVNLNNSGNKNNNQNKKGGNNLLIYLLIFMFFLNIYFIVDKILNGNLEKRVSILYSENQKTYTKIQNIKNILNGK